MELRLPLEMSPGREAACRAVFGTWGLLSLTVVFLDSSVDKEFACNSGDAEDVSLIPGSGKSPGEGHATHSSILA